MGTQKQHDLGFLAIAILKLVKGLLLLSIGVGALSLMRKDTTAIVTHWATFSKWTCTASSSNDGCYGLVSCGIATWQWWRFSTRG